MAAVKDRPVPVGRASTERPLADLAIAVSTCSPASLAWHRTGDTAQLLGAGLGAGTQPTAMDPLEIKRRLLMARDDRRSGPINA